MTKIQTSDNQTKFGSVCETESSVFGRLLYQIRGLFGTNWNILKQLGGHREEKISEWQKACRFHFL